MAYLAKQAYLTNETYIFTNIQTHYCIKMSGRPKAICKTNIYEKQGFSKFSRQLLQAVSLKY